VTKQLRAGSAILICATLSLGACGEDNGVDYCDNHYEFHSEHLDTLASLTVTLSDVGDLYGKLSMPDVAFRGIADADITMILGDARNTFSLQSEVPCELLVESISPTMEGLEANFEAKCGPGNKIGQIDVALFDHMSALEEIVVSVTTPATSKRFGISRQCDGPIFRLD